MQRAAFIRIWSRQWKPDYLLLVIDGPRGVLERREYPYTSAAGSRETALIDAREDAAELSRKYNCRVLELT